RDRTARGRDQRQRKAHEGGGGLLPALKLIVGTGEVHSPRTLNSELTFRGSNHSVQRWTRVALPLCFTPPCKTLEPPPSGSFLFPGILRRLFPLRRLPSPFRNNDIDAILTRRRQCNSVSILA